MRTDTYKALDNIFKKYREKQTGIILQCLLGLSLYATLKCPPECININLIEGVDIIVECKDFKYAIEVKTTKGRQINLGEKDFEGLKKYKGNEYTPLMAILKIDLHSQWLFINPERLGRKSSWNINELYTDDIYKNLSEKVNEMFEEMVSKYAQELKDSGSSFLLEILKEKKIRYSGK